MNHTYRRADMSQQQLPLPDPGASGYTSVSSVHAYQHQQTHQLPPPQHHQHSQQHHSSHLPPPPPPPSSHYQQPSHHPPQHQPRPEHSQHTQSQQHHQSVARRPLPPYPGYRASHTSQHALPPPHPQAHGQSRPEDGPPPPPGPAAALPSTALSKIEDGTGCEFNLEVHQQPRRARMCGFGDKDRRPITPPPCVRLVIIDTSTGKEIDYNEIDHSMFVLSVDLWNEEGTQEVNLVRSSTGPSSIAGSTTYTYPALPSPEPPAPSYSQQSLPPPNRDSTYSQPQGTGYAQDYPPQPSQSSFAHGPATPSYPASGSYGPPTQYYPQHGGYRAEASGPALQGPSNGSSYRPGYSQDQNSLTRMAVVGGQPPQGMFTRNLIGSLAASAFRLCDTEDRVGIWFVLQDLSVRTEGPFRLKFSFVNVGRTLGIEGRSSVLNQGRAPILSSCFSDVFNVYSAKKFPGVCESTPLSKTFAAQGIKIPIRKDSNMKGGDGADEEYD